MKEQKKLESQLLAFLTDLEDNELTYEEYNLVRENYLIGNYHNSGGLPALIAELYFLSIPLECKLILIYELGSLNKQIVQAIETKKRVRNN